MQSRCDWIERGSWSGVEYEAEGRHRLVLHRPFWKDSRSPGDVELQWGGMFWISPNGRDRENQEESW
jgi:hypothetical protein